MRIPRSRSSSTDPGGNRPEPQGRGTSTRRRPIFGLLVVRVRAPHRPWGLAVPLPLGFGLELLRGLELLLRLPPLERWAHDRMRGVRSQGAGYAAELSPQLLVRAGGALLEGTLAHGPFTLVEVEAPEATVKVQVL